MIQPHAKNRMATSKISAKVKQKTETVTFDSNGYATTSLSRESNVLLAARNATGINWEAYVPFANYAGSSWRIVAYKGGVVSGETRSVILYYL